MNVSNLQNRAHWILGLLLLSQFILMASSARHQDSDQAILRTWVLSVLTPPVKIVKTVVSATVGVGATYVDLRGVREQNQELLAQVEQLTEQRNAAQEQAAAYERLRRELGLPANTQYRQVAANVISRERGIWNQRLIIDRGSIDDIKIDMPVVTARGLVGRIVAVGLNCATVQPLTDRRAGVGGTIQKNGEKGDVRGTDQPVCELKEIPSGVDVTVGDVIVSSGLDRLYPAGLMIGTVKSVEDDPNAPWHKIIVEPAAQIRKVEAVMILLVEPKDLKMLETIK